MAIAFSSGASSRELRLFLQLETVELKLLKSLRQKLNALKYVQNLLRDLQ